ncbi:DNA polymerase III subunit alpha [Rhodobium orientis]|uniref:DNA polymerase III subunit alpha n=2 Tax=Rhodobium orientis TaxID=34017 RepID=A0A327JQZ1_9HYPH|nr:DNA polymerase III subunit alpha [Rhodobium orientis]RAI28697.1 DNA polymerase III subunit alpha [Rhodobium orientis]
MDAVGFLHLRVHSGYSLLEGALPLKRLLDLALGDRQPALGIADTGNLFGALEFSEKAAGAGIQPIVGCQLAVDFEDATADERRPHNGGQHKGRELPSLVLIAADEAGYGNLVRLVSHSFLDTDNTMKPHVTMDRLAAASDGLIVLTGGTGGPVNQALLADSPVQAEARLDRLAAAFGNRLYVELQRHEDPREARTEGPLVELAYRKGLPLVATNEPFFPARDDFEAHDALICIAESRVVIEEDRRRLTPDHYFKTRAEMVELFADLPEAVQNTVEIARRCHFRPHTHKPILPRFTADAEGADPGEAAAAEAEELRAQAIRGLEHRLEVHGLAPGVERDAYEARLEHELGTISRMQYAGYFLIVSDFIKWAKGEGIPVGPGRGSGAGSLVAYALTITDLDPLRFGLLFERFLNPERVSMPDFDIDFCQDRRDEVIRYVQEKYGRDQVAQIITFGTLQARAVMRDVGRVLQMPYGQVDKLAKLVPNNPANPTPLHKAIAEEPRLQEEAKAEPIVEKLFSIATRLEGLYRHASTHAAGIVIGDRPLDELVPLYRDPRSDMPVTQFNMKWVEQAGLVKFDFLGLKTLTVLQTAVRLIARRGIDIDLSTLPLDDATTYEMLGRGETVGVFQVESQGMRRALAGMRADRFEDIVALVALYRPGPMDNIPIYNARKHGEEEPDYLHPLLEPILKETFGVIIYQEQVMQIAQVMSGYSLGEADLLRRAMGKKIQAEMDAQRERFVGGAIDNGIGNAKANQIFDLLAKFANYGFNKSHAAAYALVAYQTAYLKANYPVEFLAASMTLDMGNTDKLHEFKREAERLGIPVVPPSVNRTATEFDVADGSIVYTLAALKGVGRQVVEHIVETRGDKPFKDLTDFAGRISPRYVNKRCLESLVAAGALSDMEPNRARLMNGLDRILGEAARTSADEGAGQSQLFSGFDAPSVRLDPVDAWLPAEQLQREFDAIGFYLSAHPLDEYRSVLKKLNIQFWAEFVEAAKGGAPGGRLVGTITSRQERRSRNGNRIGIIQLSDPTGQFEAMLFSDMLNEYRDLLEPGTSVVLDVLTRLEEDSVGVRVQTIRPLDDVAVKANKEMRVYVRDGKLAENLSRRLDKRGGGGDVSVVLLLDGGMREVEIRLPGSYNVSPQIAGALKTISGVIQVEMQ